jgi:hypothetical protein
MKYLKNLNLRTFIATLVTTFLAMSGYAAAEIKKVYCLSR